MQLLHMCEPIDNPKGEKSFYKQIINRKKKEDKKKSRMDNYTWQKNKKSKAQNSTQMVSRHRH